MKIIKKVFAIVLSVVIALSTMTIFASAANPTFPKSKAENILNNISSEYGVGLSAEIYDMFYDSDYSCFVSDKTTLRNYYTNGNKKMWPLPNSDPWGQYVIDRGEKVDWGRLSAGCMSYAYFFTYSVYGSLGKKGVEIVIDKNDLSTIEEYITSQIQPGEQIRIDSTHSLIFLDYGKESGKKGFYFSEFRGGSLYVEEEDTYIPYPDKDQISVGFISYETLATRYDTKIMFIYNVYESSAFSMDWLIKDPSRQEIRYKDGIILHARLDRAPEGSYVVWESSNNNFDEYAEDGTLEIIAKKKGWTEFTATLYDADGNKIGRDSVEIYSKSGLASRIGGFFRSIFGTTKIYQE